MDAASSRPPRRVPAQRREGGPLDPAWKSVELIQRGRMILDVAAADLEVSEAVHGPFHPTSWHFRHALMDARKSWDRLRAEFGGAALEAALDEPPLAILTIGSAADLPTAILIPIAGKTYRVERITGTEPAPIQWRLIRLPSHDDGPYYACRLKDGTTQCDCAEWTYQVTEISRAGGCKHLAALASLGWI
jgi:hypothetical protein